MEDPAGRHPLHQAVIEGDSTSCAQACAPKLGSVDDALERRESVGE
jgi:hypothetical protein